MQQETYKNYRIDHVYDCSEGYEEINHFTIWTPNDLDCVAEEFATIENAKTWIDDNGKPTIKKSDIKYSVEGDFYFIEDDNSEINVFKNYNSLVDFLISFADENDYFSSPPPGVFDSEGSPNVGVTFTNITTTGMKVITSAPFTGEIRYLCSVQG